jgi:hypothetical protein
VVNSVARGDVNFVELGLTSVLAVGFTLLVATGGHAHDDASRAAGGAAPPVALAARIVIKFVAVVEASDALGRASRAEFQKAQGF